MMRVTLRGYARDHGAIILVEEELDQQIAYEGATNCPVKGSVLEQVSENGCVAHFKFRQRVPLNMNGNYVLEISLATTEIAKLCWLAFRSRALSALLRLFGTYEREEIEIEEQIAQAQKLRLQKHNEEIARRRKMLTRSATAS
jgi:hypothetical protein